MSHTLDCSQTQSVDFVFWKALFAIATEFCLVFFHRTSERPCKFGAGHCLGYQKLWPVTWLEMWSGKGRLCGAGGGEGAGHGELTAMVSCLDRFTTYVHFSLHPPELPE